MKRLLLIFSFLVCLAASLAAQDMASFEKRVTVKKLPNGLTVVICERHEAPVVSFFTHVNAGDAQDPKGQTGLAHMFEHMAFKGTDKIGTANWPAEPTPDPTPGPATLPSVCGGDATPGNKSAS